MHLYGFKIYNIFIFFQTNLPVFKVKDSSVRRRYSDFEWLRNELERDSKVIISFLFLLFFLNIKPLIGSVYLYNNFVFFILSKIVVPPLPGKAWKRQMPFRGDDGIFEDDFIEDRRKGLELFVNK